MAVRIEEIPCTVLDEAHMRQVEEAMYTLSEGPEGLYKRPSLARNARSTPGTAEMVLRENKTTRIYPRYPGNGEPVTLFVPSVSCTSKSAFTLGTPGI